MRKSILGLLVIGLLAMACAGTSALPLTGPARDPSAVFFVENHGKDERNLEEIIARVIQARGIEATAGAQGQRPANATFTVTYEDRWAWDMRTYLRMIQIDVRETKTGEIVATSRSHQDSLTSMGKTYEAIIERTTNQLLDGAP